MGQYMKSGEILCGERQRRHEIVDNIQIGALGVARKKTEKSAGNIMEVLWPRDWETDRLDEVQWRLEDPE